MTEFQKEKGFNSAAINTPNKHEAFVYVDKNMMMKLYYVSAVNNGLISSVFLRKINIIKLRYVFYVSSLKTLLMLETIKSLLMLWENLMRF